MNAELDEAVGLPAPPATSPAWDARAHRRAARAPGARIGAGGSRWPQRIAAELDPDRFGVRGVYVFGSTKNATAGPGSDIDLLIHFRGHACADRRAPALARGLEPRLAEMNYLRTGYRSERPARRAPRSRTRTSRGRSSFAVKIGAVTDAARPALTGHTPRRHLRAARASPARRRGIEAHQREFRPVVRRRKAVVRPIRSRHAPVSRADSWTWPWSASVAGVRSRKRRIAMLPTWTSSGTCVDRLAVERGAVEPRVSYGGEWNRQMAPREVVVAGQSRRDPRRWSRGALVRRDRHRAPSLLGRHATGVDERETSYRSQSFSRNGVGGTQA